MKIVILTVNKNGERIAKRLKQGLKDATVLSLKTRLSGRSLKEKVEACFHKYDGLIFVAATGIVIRLIAPSVKSKLVDPAVVCVDSAARYAISLLSGQEGGANDLASRVGALLGADPIITTATEANKKITLGVGCRLGVSGSKVKQAIKAVARENGIALEGILRAATVDLKKDEAGVLEACAELKLPLVFKTKEQLAGCIGPVTTSAAVYKNLGLDGVCEPCALLAGRRTRLIVPKQVRGDVTIAFAKESSR